MHKKPLPLIALVTLASVACSQTLSDALPTGEPLQLPGTVCGISVVNGSLYCNTKDLTLRVAESHGMLSNIEPERLIARKGVRHILQHPDNNDIYYTRRFLFFKTKLYWQPSGNNGKGKVLRPGSRWMEVEHPAISDDGRYMVFSAKANDGEGGKDLYLTFRTAQGWDLPTNLGKDVNTSGNETAPTIWGDYLLFASDGQAERVGGTDIYAMKISVAQTDANASSRPEITYGKPQPLPYPFNSKLDDRMAIVHEGITYVVREGNEGGMGDLLYAFDCTPDMVTLSGVVVNQQGHPQPRTLVTLNTNDRKSIETLTDRNGRYTANLRKDRLYTISFGKVSFANDRRTVDTKRHDTANLIEKRTLDIELASFDPGQYIELQGLFGDNASIDISAEGRDKLAPIISFLKGNPGVMTQITVYCGLEENREFNSALAERRTKALGEYLRSQIPAARNLNVTNGGSIDVKKTTVKVNDLVAIKLGIF